MVDRLPRELLRTSVRESGRVTGLEVDHERDERLDAFQRHAVVERRAQTADVTMPLQLEQARSGRLLHEQSVQRCGRAPERDVRVAAPARILHIAAVEAARLVDGRVQQRGLLGVTALHLDEPTLGLDPPQHHQQRVDVERGRRVETGVGRCVLVEPTDLRDVARDERVHVLADDDQCDSGDAEVLLAAGVDQCTVAHRVRARECLGAHVDDHAIVEVGRPDGHAVPVDGLVGDDMGEAPLASLEQHVEILDGGLVAPDVVDDAHTIVGHLPGSVGRLVAPVARDDEAGRRQAGQREVLADHRHHASGSALQEQHVVIVAESEQLLGERDGFSDDRIELLRAMGDLSDAIRESHEGSGANRVRQHSRTSTEVPITWFQGTLILVEVHSFERPKLTDNKRLCQ